jgi:hypothetical protein
VFVTTHHIAADAALVAVVLAVLAHPLVYSGSCLLIEVQAAQVERPEAGALTHEQVRVIWRIDLLAGEAQLISMVQRVTLGCCSLARCFFDSSAR